LWLTPHSDLQVPGAAAGHVRLVGLIAGVARSGLTVAM
jgi:hypothetical protein